MTELAVGQTIRLNDGRDGVIRFVGQTAFASGDWVGVELEDSTGKNDGSVQGERYFDCAMGRGMFVRPTTVTILAAAPTPKPAGGIRRTGRPSSMFTGAGPSRAGTGGDTGLGKRMSLNAPSPSPGPRTSRPSSIARVGIPDPSLTMRS
jgi:dynactin 1